MVLNTTSKQTGDVAREGGGRLFKSRSAAVSSRVNGRPHVGSGPRLRDVETPLTLEISTVRRTSTVQSGLGKTRRRRKPRGKLIRSASSNVTGTDRIPNGYGDDDGRRTDRKENRTRRRSRVQTDARAPRRREKRRVRRRSFSPGREASSYVPDEGRRDRDRTFIGRRSLLGRRVCVAFLSRTRDYHDKRLVYDLRINIYKPQLK